ncbi:MAG: efflux RND transporter periplasmic adaptor subunit, partial [Kofleriaceae bacterium]
MVAAPVEHEAEVADFPAVVTSRRTKVVVAEFQGKVERLDVYAGQRVKAGDPIARLDDTELKLQVEAARFQEQAALNDAGSSGAQAGRARQLLATETRLVRGGVSPRQAIKNARAELAMYGASAAGHKARAQGHRAERERLEGLLARAQLVAPFDGVAMMIKTKEGLLAEKGTPIAQVFDPSDLIVKFSVPRGPVRERLARGQRVELQVEGGRRPIWATIEKIADEAPPLHFAVVEADIDDAKLMPDELRVT